MRILLCPTAFKESLGAAAVTAAMRDGLRRALPDARVEEMPLSDGGPGLLDALSARHPGRVETVRVHGPLGAPVAARILRLPATGEAGAPSPPGAEPAAAAEAADACGLHLVQEPERDPMRADTRGVGELLVACRARGARDLALGLGGSGTVDGGTGMARALGFRFLDASGGVLAPGGAALARLARIEPPGSGERAADANWRATAPEVTALADVRSPLLGPDGAARRFAPQKGADADQVARLEEGLARLAELCARDLGAEVRDVAGAGAAGGLGAGCVAFLGARLVPGADWLMERLGFDAALASAELVVTGEGAWDATSGLGKVTDRVIERARAAGVPVLLVCGRVVGRAPPGVRAADGGGAWLDEEGLAALVARSV